MCDIQLEQAEVFTDTWVNKARTHHQCASCLAGIAPGDRYLKHFQVFEGHVFTEKCCEACAEDRAQFGSTPGHGVGLPSDLLVMLESCISDGDGDSEWVAMTERLAARRRANVASRAEQEGGAA